MPQLTGFPARATRRSLADRGAQSLEPAGRMAELATWVVIGYAVAVTVYILFYFTFWPLAPRDYFRRDDVIAITVVLPLLIALVRTAARGLHTRGSWWLLAGLAAVVLSMIPFGGVLWLLELQVLAGAVLLIVPLVWSAGLFTVLVLLPVAVAHAEHQAQWSTFLFMKTLQGGLSLAVLVWLVQVIRRAQAARLELAEAAVIAERLRIDAELTKTVNAALEQVIIRGQQVAEELADRQLAAVRLRALAEFSRHTLTQSRQLLTGYQAVSAAAELQAAVTLLSMGGVGVRLELPPGGPPEVLPAALRVRLRSAVAQLLAGEGPDNCVICLVPAGSADGFELLVKPGTVAGRGAA
jgi:hypothetical protein